MLKAIPVIRIVLVLALSLSCSQSFAVTYYVQTSGSDANDGLDTSTAFLTIKKAATVISSGDTVEIGAGTYTDDIEIVGVQQSTQTVRFIGDPSGSVIISDATLSVFNSNYVEFENLNFQGSKRFLVVSGSYETVFTSCQFNSGSEPLLIKDGKLTFETCSLLDFSGDGLRVDGEAIVNLNGSTISGCQAEGIEISATAKVVLNGTTLSDNTGDGIKVEDGQVSIDPGDPPGGGGGMQVGLITGLMGIKAEGGGFVSYDSTTGTGTSGAGGGAGAGGQANLYSNGSIATTSNVLVDGDVYLGPSGTATIPNLSGTITKVDTEFVLAPIDPGNVRTVNDNGNIPLTDKGNNAIDGTGHLVLAGNKQGGDGVTLPPGGTYYFKGMTVSGASQLRVTGPTTIYIEGPVNLTGGNLVNLTQKPENLKILVLGNNLLNLSGFAALHAAIYAPDAIVEYHATTAKGKVSDPAGIFGMVIANGISLSAQGGIRADLALQTYADSLTGSSSGTPSVPAPPSGWQPIANVELDITGGAMTGNRRAVNLVSSATFNAQGAVQFSQNDEWGLCLNGPFDLNTCTIDGNGIGGVWLTGVNDGDFVFTKLTISNNPQYGMYLENCQVTFDNISLDDYTFTTGSAYILASQGGSLTLDGVTIKDGTSAGVSTSGGTLHVKKSNFSGNGYGIAADQSTVTIENSNSSGNNVGLYSNKNPTLTVTNTTLSNNTSWGAAIYLSSTTGASTTFSGGSTVSGNAGGIAISDATNGTLALPNTTIQNNTNDGLRLENCDLTLSAANTSGLQITNHQYGVHSINSTLVVDGLTLSGGSTAALYAVGGSLDIDNSTFSGSGYGIWAVSCNSVTANTCTLSGNNVGLYADQNTALQATDVTFTGNTQWGATVYPKTSGGLSVTFDACTFHTNAGGLTLANAVDGQVSLTSGTLLRDNTNSGLHLENCDLTLNDQAAGANWRTLRNHYGISANAGSVTLDGTVVEESASYAVYSTNGSLTVRNSTLSGRDGIFVQNNSSSTVESTFLTSTASGVANWGIHREEGILLVTNSVIAGFRNGIYLEAAISLTANVLNTTIVNTSNYGVYVANGPAQLVNNIIAGSGATSGVVDDDGQLTHSYNLIYGFATPLVGTTLHATEIQKSPRFVDAAGGNFRLGKGSPAINVGTDLTSTISSDMDGNTRPSHQMFEMGAYEYMSSAGSFRVLNWKEQQ